MRLDTLRSLVITLPAGEPMIRSQIAERATLIFAFEPRM